MPHMPMLHEVDPAQALIDALGDISSVEVFHSQVLLAIYIRPVKTKSGLIMTEKYVDEDRHQSKVGLLVARGPEAFNDASGQWFNNITIRDRDWLFFRASDGWNITVNGVLCRMFEDINIKGRVAHPDEVY